MWALVTECGSCRILFENHCIVYHGSVFDLWAYFICLGWHNNFLGEKGWRVEKFKKPLLLSYVEKQNCAQTKLYKTSVLKDNAAEMLDRISNKASPGQDPLVFTERWVLRHYPISKRVWREALVVRGSFSLENCMKVSPKVKHEITIWSSNSKRTENRYSHKTSLMNIHWSIIS